MEIITSIDMALQCRPPFTSEQEAPKVQLIRVTAFFVMILRISANHIIWFIEFRSRDEKCESSIRQLQRCRRRCLLQFSYFTSTMTQTSLPLLCNAYFFPLPIVVCLCRYLCRSDRFFLAIIWYSFLNHCCSVMLVGGKKTRCTTSCTITRKSSLVVIMFFERNKLNYCSDTTPISKNSRITKVVLLSCIILTTYSKSATCARYHAGPSRTMILQSYVNELLGITTEVYERISLSWNERISSEEG